MDVDGVNFLTSFSNGFTHTNKDDRFRNFDYNNSKLSKIEDIKKAIVEVSRDLLTYLPTMHSR